VGVSKSPSKDTLDAEVSLDGKREADTESRGIRRTVAPRHHSRWNAKCDSIRGVYEHRSAVTQGLWLYRYLHTNPSHRTHRPPMARADSRCRTPQ